ncbi:hypothetical protein Q8A73_009386 [Channa argus]|nr:hypothetical protein Q8A73_009386 [Channa argus]
MPCDSDTRPSKPSQVENFCEGVELELLSEVAPVIVWRLVKAIEKHETVSVDLDHYDLASLTDTLRGFLQDLPTPIIPTSVYSELVYTAQESPTVEECGEKLRRILESPSIPQTNHQLLVHLSRHLARVSQHSQADPRLLGQAFAEAVFKHSSLSEKVNPEHHVRILEALIATGGLVEMQAAPALHRKLQWKTHTQCVSELRPQDVCSVNWTISRSLY